jgi:predicted RND superfamily exporter protein
MKGLMHSMERHFENIPDWLRKRRVFVWLLFVAITIFMVVGMGRTQFDTSIEGWFQKDDPTIVAFDWFHHEFGSDDHLYIVYKPKDGNVFSERSLRTLKQLQQELKERVSHVREGDPSPLAHVVKITSLINAPVLTADSGVLISRKLVGDEVPSSPEGLDRIRRIAESQKNFPLLYFSRDYKYGGIFIETNFGAIPVQSGAAMSQHPVTDLKFDDPAGTREQRPKFQPTTLAEYFGLMSEVKKTLNKPEFASYFEYYPVGSTASAEYSLAMVENMGMLNMAALILMMVLLWFVFRSLSAVVWPVVIVVLSSVWTVGITVWMGLPVTFFVMVTVMLTLAIGIADTVHMISAYLTARNNDGLEHQAALRKAFKHVAVPCFLTTITNIVAVVALSLTPIVPIQVFAFMCSLGVGLPFLFSVYLLPLMLDLWAPKKAAVTSKGRLGALVARLLPDMSLLLERLLKKVLPTVEKAPVSIIVLFTAVLAVCTYGAFQTKVDTDPVGSFPKDSKMRQSVQVVDRNMMGAQSMEIYLDLGKENAFHDPFVLHAVERLQSTIEHKYSDVVVRTNSLVNEVKSSYKTLNDGRPDRYVIPDSSTVISQTLFLFNQSTPDDRKKLVSDNYDRARISVRMYNRGSYEYTRTWDSMRADIDASVRELQRKYPEAKVSITGMLTLMMQGADYLTSNELQSFVASILLVCAVLLVLFGSFKAGTIALVPNLMPSILAYGSLGLLDLPLDITTMMIAPIIIGIAVDDTVHFVTHYRHEVIIDGDIRRALQAAISNCGQSVVFATLVLGLGFGVMAFASNGGVANLGIFGALAIFVGLLNDLFLLPAIILVFKPRLAGHAHQRRHTAPELSSSALDS